MNLTIRMVISFTVIVASIMMTCDREKELPQNETPPAEELQAHPMDGRGAAIVIPDDPVLAADRGSWKVHFFPGEEGIDTGGGILFQIWRLPLLAHSSRGGEAHGT
jgi:hypothetical protein